MVLVAGATGSLGGTVCRMLVERGTPVRALVRSSSSAERVAELRALGVELALGDLCDPESLRRACRGVDRVVSTVTATSAKSATDTILNVDGDGQVALIDAAQHESVKHFVYVSVSGGIHLDSPLQSAKRRAEERLHASGMTYTVLRPTAFADIWLSAHLGFDVLGGAVTVLGSGDASISFISVQDVARFCVIALDDPSARNCTIELGGPAGVTFNEAVRIAETVLGRVITVQHVPLEALRAQYENATEPLQKTFAALACGLAQGDVVDMSETLERFPMQLRTVRQYFEELAKQVPLLAPR